MLRSAACLLLFAAAFSMPVAAKPPAVQRDAVNPPPPVALSTYDRFEI